MSKTKSEYEEAVKNNMGIYTSYTGNNDLLFNQVSKLYFHDGDKIADVTYGKGVFWKTIDTSKYNFFASDKITCPKAKYDFCNLPYKSETFDVVVFDPPYAHNPGSMIVNNSYQNKETTRGFYHKDIINLYRSGMEEGYRILKKQGLLLVKCQDEIESSKQKRSHIEIFNIAIDELGMKDKDLFVLTQKRFPVIQHSKQQHARKNNSFLWVLVKI
jgi:tRNA G10  N-methylase Trm11